MARSDIKKLYVHAGDTYDVETESLEAHVAICSERYFAIHFSNRENSNLEYGCNFCNPPW